MGDIDVWVEEEVRTRENMNLWGRFRRSLNGCRLLQVEAVEHHRANLRKSVKLTELKLLTL